MSNLSTTTIAGTPVLKDAASKTPRLTVVGAGIGDPELMTLKAVRVLGQADVVLYDALVSPDLLEYAPSGAARIYVGKRRSHKAFTQEEINEMIVGYAKDYGHVVRLKGGDPFVFGRGFEEMQYAQSHGVAVEYVPGISSAIAAPAAAGIPVTLRGASRSFWVLTATTDAGVFNPEIALAAQTDATLVILMGLSKIADIAAAFLQTGKDNLPIAIIQNATLPEQQVIVGTIADIVEKTRQANTASPAVIVAGAVVHNRLALEQLMIQEISTLPS
ncbi:MAG: uroporphyrinogen-III C-methyltransferase [Saprospiraceae bacterium]|nr:uroporphyrinogen-III C-methyltransferase [Saprospiraceae bacterium]